MFGSSNYRKSAKLIIFTFGLCCFSFVVTKGVVAKANTSLSQSTLLDSLDSTETNLALSNDEDIANESIFEEQEASYKKEENYEFADMLENMNSKNVHALYLLHQPETRASVEWFYIQVTNDRDVALAIIDAADEYNIPLSLAFSVAYAESQYKSYAKHENANGTIDRGLFQLNSASFPHLTEEQFFNPKSSAHYGLSHLRFCLDSAGNEIAAIAMYNAGTNKVHSNRTPKMTLDYISRIEEYKSKLENNFNRDVLAYYINANNNVLLARK